MEAVQKTPEREAFYRKIDGENLSALWNVMGDLITPEPRSACRPHLWKFDSIRDYMTEAGKLITAKEAERRVLVLENPGLRGQSKITTSLFAGVQMVVPGDVAPAHRHSQSALRFVLEGKGAYTAVDGERTAMEPGDFVITPSMTWHDHSNETNEPMFWLDGLDIPMVQFFDASFAEGSNEDQQKITRPAGDSFARYGHNLLPVDEKRSSKTSPIFNYPYSYTREALEQAKARNEWDACHGLKLKFSNPETGDFAMPTIGTFIQLLPKGFKTARYRSTDATVFAAIEGKGRTRIGDQTFEWGAARSVRGAELALGHPRGRGRLGAVQFLRPPGAAEARSVPRRSRQRVRDCVSSSSLRTQGPIATGHHCAEGVGHCADRWITRYGSRP